MSTFLETTEPKKRISSVEDLAGYFHAHAKPKGKERIGIECEVFGVDAVTGRALPYSGERGIEAALKLMAGFFGYETVLENGRVIALKKPNGNMVTLEPGGQVELSGRPVQSVHEVQAQLELFFHQLKAVSAEIGGMEWLAGAVQPFSDKSEIEWVPKQRYRIMADYLAGKGALAHDMMKRTATNQVNLDYEDECDAVWKLRLGLSITPFASAMFAASGFSNGAPNGFQSERLHIWRFTDPDRTGLVLDLACRKCTFRDYLNYVLDIPMFFIVRDGRWTVPPHLTFRKFIENGYEGLQAFEDDFDLHLSTIFTDVRFKHYVEIRGMDAQRRPLIPAVAAFWKGIFYDLDARLSAESLLKPYCREAFAEIFQAVEREGLRARFGNGTVLDIARELVSISEAGLKQIAHRNAQGEDESMYRVPLKEEILKPGKSPTDKFLEYWEGARLKNPSAVIDYFKI